jgi:hypothetical protein
MPDDPESLTLRATVIGGIRCADDCQVIWRGLTIGRIMRIDSRASDANIAAMAGPGGCTPEASAGPRSDPGPHFLAGRLPFFVLKFRGCRLGSWPMSPSVVPSIVPNGSDETVYIVVNDFGSLGASLVETDLADRSTSKPRSRR